MAPEKVSWFKSNEKKVLYNDIADGSLAGMSPKEVYETRDGIYKKFAYIRFRTNLNNLRKAVAKDFMYANRAKAAFDNDKIFYPRPSNYFVWRGSDEQRQLRKDIQSGEMDDKEPMQARMYRTMYSELPISKAQWRNYLWQERRRHFNQIHSNERKEIIRMKTEKIFQK